MKTKEIKTKQITLKNSDQVFVRSKHLDRTPDLTSEEYWDKTNIYIAEIVSKSRNNLGEKTLTLRVTERFNGTGPEELSILRRHVETSEQFVDFNPGDSLLVFSRKKGTSQLFAHPRNNSDQQTSLILSIREILSIRKNPILQNLAEGCNSEHALVQQFCLSSMSNRIDELKKLTGIHRKFAASLDQTRNDSSKTAQARLAASRLFLQLENKREFSSAEYDWLKKAIKTSFRSTERELVFFIKRLLESSEHREQTADFLIQLARNPKMADPIRYAAFGSLDDPRLIDAESPDKATEKIFQLCIDFLGSPDSNFRRTSAHFLCSFCSQFSISAKTEICEMFRKRAQKAIDSLVQNEKDEVVRFHAEGYLADIS